MWGAITKDFGEFVSTVAADANETLEKIDQNLDEPLIKGRSKNSDDGDTINEGVSEAMIDADTGIPMSLLVDDDDDDDDGKIVPWKTPEEASPEEMKERLVSCEDVFKDPLIVPGENEQEQEEEDEGEEATEELTKEENEEQTVEKVTPPEQSEETATTPPREENKNEAIATFLEGFNLETKTEEITKLLETNAALQTTFSILSDSVTYADFWTRYFYRIDDETNNLLNTYAVYYQKHLEELELEREAATEAERASKASANSGAARLSSFFGGVVSKLTSDEGGESGDDDYNTSYDQDPDTSGMVDESMNQTFDSEDGPVAAARSALGFLSTAVAGRGGRPPFVMNTAVSDDDDDDEGAAEEDDDEDDDSEVELGWDDDDDEDFDGLDEDEEDTTDQIAFEDGDDRSETVDFKDAEKEGLLEELEQARAERDALQKTVEMQTEELKKAAEAGPSSPSIVAGSNASESDVVQSLKMQLFEKEAELAALRSNLDDRDDDIENENDDQRAELEAETLQLKQALEAKGRDFETLKKATQAQTLAFEQKLQEQAELQTELETLKDTVTAKDQELETLLNTKDDEYTKLQQKIDEKPTELEDMILALQSQIYALKRQLEEKQNVNNLDQSVDSVNSLDEAEEFRKALSSRDAEISSLQSKAKESTAHINELKTQLSTKTKELEQALEESTAQANELQTQLFDKTKELEQVLEESKAQTNDTSETKELEHAIEELQSQLAQRTEELEKSTNQISDTTKELEQALGHATGLQTRINKLETDLASKEMLTKRLEAEVEVLKKQLVTCGEEAQQKIGDATHQHEATILDLETELKASKDELNASKESGLETQKEIERLRKQLLEQQRASTPTSPGSSSSGVKVDVPQDNMETAAATVAASPASVPTPPPPQIPDTPNAAVSLGLEPSEKSEQNDDDAGGDENDDGWGDDW